VNALNDPQGVREEYATEAGLLGRRMAYEHASGPNPVEEAFAAIEEGAPRRVLEVGCGPGELAERVQAELGAEVVAIDISPRMVELTRARGVDARVGDVQDLPFGDGEFDCAIAAWMLYHVPDVPKALAELARVLCPGGRLVAVTNRREHLQELCRLFEHWPASAFGDVSGPALLAQHFSHIEERDVGGWVDFPDRDAVLAYIGAMRQFVPAPLPPDMDVPLRVRRAPVIYVATK
jgi:SAM-dependent methyltransferase